MCGIAGIFGSGREQMSRVLAAIAHRGPDSGQSVPLDSVDGELGHRRLSIIDLSSRSDQPFTSADGRYVFVYNGELYNYRTLRSRMQRDGVDFRTESDTEVIFHWLIRNGERGLLDLDGMYAFALVDLTEKRLLIARDPIGEKPLYYTRDSVRRRFAFCSEIKGLLQLPGVDTSVNEEALANYVRFLYTAPPHTLYEGIKELPPGHFLSLDLRTHAFQLRAFYDLEERVHAAMDGNRPADPAETFRELFTRSVGDRLQSDVPVTVYLSGGLDSSAIAATAAAHEREATLETYTVRYPDAPFSDESGLARTVAAELGATSSTVDFTLALPVVDWSDHLLGVFDQPFGNATAIVALELARTVARKHRVALVGDGGDEVAVGYPRYKALLHHRIARRAPAVSLRLASRIADHLPRSDRGILLSRRMQQFLDAAALPAAEAFLGWSTYLPDADVDRALGRAGRTQLCDDLLSLFRRNEDDLHRAASLVDFASFVPFNLMQCADRTSMAASLEVRSPFLATSLVEYALALPSSARYRRGENKPLISRGFAGLIPEVVQNQPKRPFNPPVFRWLQRNVRAIEEQLLAPDARIGEVLDRGFLKAQVQDFASGRRDNSTWLWGMVMLERWLLQRNRVASPDPQRLNLPLAG